MLPYRWEAGDQLSAALESALRLALVDDDFALSVLGTTDPVATIERRIGPLTPTEKATITGVAAADLAGLARQWYQRWHGHGHEHGEGQGQAGGRARARRGRRGANRLAVGA